VKHEIMVVAVTPAGPYVNYLHLTADR